MTSAEIVDLYAQGALAVRVLAAALGGEVLPFVHHDTLEMRLPAGCTRTDAFVADAMKALLELPPHDPYARVGELLGLPREEVKRRAFAVQTTEGKP